MLRSASFDGSTSRVRSLLNTYSFHRLAYEPNQWTGCRTVFSYGGCDGQAEVVFPDPTHGMDVKVERAAAFILEGLVWRLLQFLFRIFESLLGVVGK